MNYNLNDKVKVVLTAEGAQILNEKLLNKYLKIGQTVQHWWNKNDTYETYLWILMEEFGPHITITSPQFFENNNIELE